MENVWLALIVAVPALLSPLLLSWLNNRNAIKIKEQDYARQDAVAERAAAASRELLERQDRAAEAQEANTRLAVASRKQTYSQLSAIHSLVNSNMTAALQAELDSTRRELAALEEIREIKREAGKTPRVEATVVIESARARVLELEGIMAERREQDDKAKNQMDNNDAVTLAADAAATAAPAAAEKAARKIVPPVVTQVVPPVVKAAVKEALEEHDSKEKS